MLTSPARAEVIELAPSGDWVVSFDDSSCALHREFGGSENLVLMELRQFRPGDSYQLVVTTKAYRANRGRIKFALLPDDAPDYESGFGVNSADGAQGFAFLGSFKQAADREIASQLKEDGLPVPLWPLEDQIARERSITGILLDEAFSRDLLLQTGRLDQPMNVMRTCMDDLVGSWGIDVLAHQTLSRAVEPDDLSEWARHLQQQYPSSMLSEGRQAIVWARVTVGIDGRGAQCAVQSTMNDTEFNEVACNLLLEHGRWQPALDAQSQPIVSYWVGSITYEIS